MAIRIGLPSGESITLNGPVVTIGTDRACDVVVPAQDGVRPRHAQIKMVASRWMAESEGDWLIQAGNGVPARKCWLKPGDQIRLTESGIRIVFDPVVPDGSVRHGSATSAQPSRRQAVGPTPVSARTPSPLPPPNSPPPLPATTMSQQVVRTPVVPGRSVPPLPIPEQGTAPEPFPAASPIVGSSGPPPLPKSEQGVAPEPFPKSPSPPTGGGLTTARHRPQETGFYRYWTDYYRATHGLGIWSLGIILGLVSMPLLSLLKPLLGFKGILWIWLGLAGIAGTATVVFLVRRALAYYLRNEWIVPQDVTSWSSLVAHACWTMLIPLCLLVAVEFFAPPIGIVTTLVPSFREDQARWVESLEAAWARTGSKRDDRNHEVVTAPSPPLVQPPTNPLPKLSHSPSEQPKRTPSPGPSHVVRAGPSDSPPLGKLHELVDPTGNPRVFSISFSPDTKTLVDNELRLWDVTTGAILHRGPQKFFLNVGHVAFGSDGRTVALTHTWMPARRKLPAPPPADLPAHGIITLWDVATDDIALLTNPGEQPSQGETAFSITFSPDGRLLATAQADASQFSHRVPARLEDGLIRLWDVVTRNLLAELKGNTSYVRSVAFSSDGKLLASGHVNGTIQLWDVATKRNIATLNNGLSRSSDDTSVNHIVFSGDGRFMASATGRDLTLWDVSTNKKNATFERPATIRNRCLDFTPDCKTLVCADESGVQLWDIGTGQSVGDVRLGTAALAISANGRFLATAPLTGGIHVWDMKVAEQPSRVGTRQADQSPVRPDQQSTGALKTTTSSPHAHATQGEGYLPCAPEIQYDSKSLRLTCKGKLTTRGMACLRVLFTPSGNDILVTGQRNGDTVSVCDVVSGKPIGAISGMSPEREFYGPVIAVAMSSDGHFLATGDPHGRVQLWDWHKVLATLRSGTPEEGTRLHEWETMPRGPE